MNELDEICGRPQSELGGMDVDELRAVCVNARQAFELPAWELILVLLFAILGAALVAIVRSNAGEPAWRVIGTTVEGGLYGALGAYAGTTFGLLVAEVVPNVVLGLLFAILGLFALVFAVIATARGSGGAGWKVFGFLQFLVVAAVLLVLTVVSFGAGDDYEQYLNTVALLLGVTAGTNGVLVALYRGAHWSVGWILVPLNGAWGFVGNLLGLMTYVASFNFYADHGKFHKPSDRRYYVCYERGFSLKNNVAGDPFAFTQGAVMTADTDELRRHEGIHALQHYVFGPIYPISHFLWFVPMAVVGVIAAASEKQDSGYGVTAMSYYNNPWEVVAYAFGGHRDSTQPLIWGSPGAGIAAGLWIVLATVAFVILLTVWT